MITQNLFFIFYSKKNLQLYINKTGLNKIPVITRKYNRIWCLLCIFIKIKIQYLIYKEIINVFSYIIKLYIYMKYIYSHMIRNCYT